MRTHEPDLIRLQLLVQADPNDAAAWYNLVRAVTRQSGQWDACGILRSYVAQDLDSTQRAAFIRGFLRHHPCRDDLRFHHFPGLEPHAYKGTLHELTYHLGWRGLWSEELSCAVPWSSIRGLRWGLECVLHSGGVVTIGNWRHRASEDVVRRSAEALQTLYRVARSNPASLPNQEAVQRQLQDYRTEPDVRELLSREAPQYGAYTRAYRSAAQSFARGIERLLQGCFGQAAENMLDVVPRTVRSSEKAWQQRRLWSHLLYQIPPRSDWEGGPLPDWSRSDWQETEPRLAIPELNRV